MLKQEQFQDFKENGRIYHCCGLDKTRYVVGYDLVDEPYFFCDEHITPEKLKNTVVVFDVKEKKKYLREEIKEKFTPLLHSD